MRSSFFDYEYIVKIELEELGYVGYLCIVIFESFEELEILKEIFYNLFIVYIFFDGMGIIN